MKFSNSRRTRLRNRDRLFSRFVVFRGSCLLLLVLWLAPSGCRPLDHTANKGGTLRIISLSPSITEILYGVGAFSSLVADTRFCDYPEEAKRLPHIGGFSDVNFEAIASLDPDLVMMIDDQAPLFEQKLAQLGIATFAAKIKTAVQIAESIRQIAARASHAAEGERLAAEVERRIGERAAATSQLRRPRTLLVVDRVPGTLKDLYVASRGSYLDQLLVAAGGENVAPASGEGFLKVQEEWLATINPEIIIEVVHAPDQRAREGRLSTWQLLPRIDAVKDHRVVVVDSFTTHPSQRMLESLDVFSRIIHPEAFGSYER